MSQGPIIDWSKVSTPVVEWPGYSLKDPALTWHDGWFQLVVSVFDADNHSRLGAWRSRDLAEWEGPTWEWGSGSEGWCSPDILKDGDDFIMTFQSWDAIPPRQSQNQIFYSRSSDAQGWQPPQPLAKALTQGVRAIDAALAHHGEHWFLLYKEAQTPRLATAQAIDGPWTLLPEPFPCWAENGQFIQIDGQWHLLATLEHHAQGIAKMQGDPNTVEAWTNWGEFQILDTPGVQNFNEAKAANASSLWDGREVDGCWYRIFCSAVESPDSNWGWQIGITRSRDFKTWSFPPQTQTET